ncbi:hypothetical protein, partial [Subtercola vilae]|uniref:hypothetical protein n=1 Tax=Subtercola vilae TaxID=2056433 RepID=UPI001F265616
NRPSTTPFCFTVATASSSTTSLNTSVIMFLLVRSYTENRTDPFGRGQARNSRARLLVGASILPVTAVSWPEGCELCCLYKEY